MFGNLDCIDIRNKIIGARRAGYTDEVADMYRQGLFSKLVNKNAFVQGEFCAGVSMDKDLILLDFDSISE